MTVKQRFLTTLENKKADRLPVTTHHIMDYYLQKYEGGATISSFFERHGLDPIDWVLACKPDETKGQYWSRTKSTGYSGIVSDDWQVFTEIIPDSQYKTLRYTFRTPSGDLSMVHQSNIYTSWVSEPLVKEKKDIEIIAAHVPHYLCDVDLIRTRADAMGDNGLIRTHIPSFDVAGQPGCWQDSSVLFGIQRLILETFDDPGWVKEFLTILQRRKMNYIHSMAGAPMDLIELGGGDASTTVISPSLFHEFVAPFDAPLIEAAHQSGQRIVYHTCGGMMPILEDIAAMKPDAMETFTPPGMGGDVHLADAFRRIGDKVCFIGGFNQLEYLQNSTVEQTRKEVRRCFEACGLEGGFILSPSDHFFDARPELISAFAEEAKTCLY